MNKKIKDKIGVTVGVMLAAAVFLSACGGNVTPEPTTAGEELPAAKEDGGLEYKVYPETFKLELWEKEDPEHPVVASVDGEELGYTDFSQNGSLTSWRYPEKQVQVTVEGKSDYVEVSITSLIQEDNTFSWPVVEGDVYYIPLGEGKRIPADDAAWKDYLVGERISVMEQLSMPFFAAISGDGENGESGENGKAAMYIMEHPFRSTLNVSLGADSAEQMGFTVEHQYPEITEEKVQRFRIYLTEADAASVAKQYRSYVSEQGKLKTMAEKAAENPNVEKLYGAPHIYFWNDRVIGEENIDWRAFRSQLSSEVMTGLFSFGEESEEGKELAEVLDQLAAQDYVDNYQKKVIVRGLSTLLKREDLYRAFGGESDAMKDKNMMQVIQYNKLLLVQNLPDVFLEPVSTWADSRTVDVIKDMKDKGMEHAWIGLNNWEDGFGKPELVDEAAKSGYLVGPYDSYHSIHEPGKEQWNTAAFPDDSLYESATVTDQKGEKIAGFQKVGRKLNPVLAMPFVKERVSKILDTGISFNSWFVDCDGTGEIYDDYSAGHVTTMEQDLKARLERMEYVAGEKKMVVGTEGGNDFAAGSVAFAHGLELQSFSWMDEDMKGNKESEYYLGRYYSATGGVPEKFGKPVPIKETYRLLFLDMRYQVPLYQLVYHDSMITSYHWDWSTLKIKGEEENRMLREMLYQVPPLYHLDLEIWEENKDVIVSHTKEWSQYHRRTAVMEMTDFKRISEDGLVQMTEYGNKIRIIANFSNTDYTYNGNAITPGSYLVEE